VRCVSIPTPPLIYIGVAPRVYGRENNRGLHEPPLEANEGAPHGRDKSVVRLNQEGGPSGPW
jgi:hypothetical protein